MTARPPTCGTRKLTDAEDDIAIEVDGAEIRIARGSPELKEPSPAQVNRHNLPHLPIIHGALIVLLQDARMTNIVKAPQSPRNLCLY